MPVTQIGDLDVSYSQSGSAPGLVFVHGLGQSKESWDYQLEHLTATSSLAYDVRGHGGTSTGAVDGTLAQLSTDLLELVPTVTGPVTVAGFSLGGVIALKAVTERPDLIRGAILLGTSSIVGKAAASYYDQRICDAGDTSSIRFRDAMREDIHNGLTQRRADIDETALDDLMSARLTAIGDGSGFRNAAAAMVDMHNSPLQPRVAEIRVPVHVIAGNDDALCPVKASRMIVDALPDGRLHVIADAGHLMNVERPAAVTDTIRQALRDITERLAV